MENFVMLMSVLSSLVTAMNKLKKAMSTLLLCFALISSASGDGTASKETCPNFIVIPMCIGGGLMGLWVYFVFPFNAEALDAANHSIGIFLAFTGFGVFISGVYGCAIYSKIMGN